MPWADICRSLASRVCGFQKSLDGPGGLEIWVIGWLRYSDPGIKFFAQFKKQSLRKAAVMSHTKRYTTRHINAAFCVHVIAEVQPKLEYRPCCLWCRMLIRCNDGSDWIILACQLVDYCCLVTLSLSRDLKALSTSTQKFFCTNWFKVSKMSSSCIHCILFHGSRIQNMFTIKVSSA